MRSNHILSSLSLSIVLALAGNGVAVADSTQQQADHDHHSHDHDHGHDHSNGHNKAHSNDHDHAHGHDGHELLPPVPDNHEPWAIDEPLGEGMTRVRQALAALPADAGAAIEPATVTALTGEVDAAINYMFANCSLPPEPDAALHGVLAQLMVSSRDLRDDAADDSAVPNMREAIDRYALLFDDPDARADGYGTGVPAARHPH